MQLQVATLSKNKSRFDARISDEQKAMFEMVASIGGYRSPTDFIQLAAFEKAQALIQQKEQIIASERDAKIFFTTITQTSKPTPALKKALKQYNTFLAEK